METAESKIEEAKKRRKIEMGYMIRMTFLAWKTFAQQVKHDRLLFFKLRDFIVRRLTKKAMLGLKIHYIKRYLIKQFVLKRRIKTKRLIFKECQLKNNITRQNEKRKHRQKVLRFWSRQSRWKVVSALRMNIVMRVQQRENAFKVYIFDQNRIMKLGITLLKLNIKANKLYRINNYKALRYLSKLYKKKTIQGFKEIKLIKQWYHQQQQKANNLKQRSLRNMLNIWFQEWKQLQKQVKDNHQQLVRVLNKITLLKLGFWQIKDNYHQQIQSENEKLLSQFFHVLKSHCQSRQFQRTLNQTAIYQFNSTLKKALLKLLGIHKQQSQQRKSKLQQLLNKLSLKDSFDKIYKLSQQRSVLPNLLVKLFLSRSQSYFQILTLVSKLRILQNDSILIKQKFALSFLKWKEFASYDKRQLKLLARSIKHRNRVLKAKVLQVFQYHSQIQSQILPGKQMILKRKAFNILLNNKRRKLVMKHKINKARFHFSSTLQMKYFYLLHRMTQDLQAENNQQRQQKQITNKFRRINLLTKSLNGFKVIAYRKRVYRYLQQIKFRRYGQILIENMKEGQIKQRTKGFKKLRAHRFYEESLVVKTFQVLKDRKDIRQLNLYKQHKAKRHYFSKLINKSMQALWNVTQQGLQKSRLEKQAFEERIKQSLQQSFLKMLQVGIYWTQIKGRFGNPGRLYLAMKYGIRWRMKVLMLKQQRLQGFKSSLPFKVQPIPKEVSRQIEQKLQLARSPQSQGVSNSKLILRGATIQNRIKEIEQELTVFKNKKLLYRELENQLKESTNESIVSLLQGKLQSLKNDLVKMQPIMKELLNEISRLKQQASIMVGTVDNRDNNTTFNLSRTMISTTYQ